MAEAVATVIADAFALDFVAAAVIADVLTVAAAAATFAYGNHQRRKAERQARDAYNASLEDRLVMTSTAQGVRSRVYGRVRNVDGIVYKATHGTYSEFYTFVISLAGHEVDAIETVYFDDTAVTLDGSGYVTTAPWNGEKPTNAQAAITISGGSGSVTLPHTPISGSVSFVISTGSGADQQTYSGTVGVVGSVVNITGAGADGTGTVHYQWTEAHPKARVRKYLGGASQDLSADLIALVGADVTSADKFANDASLIVTFEYDQDAFPSGIPNISAVMRGAKCYDPRSGTTVWTENPAIIARDWALYAYGMGMASSELVEAAFTAAANACDTSTVFHAATGDETRPLYQCGIVCPLDANADETFAEIVESMAGQWGWAGGKLTLRAGVYRAPVTTITEDWVTDKAAIEIVPQTSTADLVNVMRPTIADAAHDYVSAPTPEVRYTAAISADGRELPRELQISGCTRNVHAQHVAGVLMRESREGLTLTLPCNYRAWQLELFDPVAVTLPKFGFSAKAFEVTGWKFAPQVGVVLVLRESVSSAYDPDASFDVLEADNNTNLPDPASVPQVAGLTLRSGDADLTDYSVVVRAEASWTAVADEAVRQSGRIEVQYILASSTLPAGDWPSVEAAGNATSVPIYGLREGLHYLFRARARNSVGARGPWSLPVLHLVASVNAIGTGQIEPEAATELYVGTMVVGPVTFSSVA